eukprot:9038260-Lingulodinium_polyedra.AAC.1
MGFFHWPRQALAASKDVHPVEQRGDRTRPWGGLVHSDGSALQPKDPEVSGGHGPRWRPQACGLWSFAWP